jgi:hypothetical protein
LQRIALGLLGRLKGDAHRGHQAGTALVDGIEGAGPDQRLDDAAVGDALVDAPAEIEQVREIAAFLAGARDGADGRLAGALDGAQPVADGLRIDRRSGSGCG